MPHQNEKSFIHEKVVVMADRGREEVGDYFYQIASQMASQAARLLALAKDSKSSLQALDLLTESEYEALSEDDKSVVGAANVVRMEVVKFSLEMVECYLEMAQTAINLAYRLSSKNRDGDTPIKFF